MSPKLRVSFESEGHTPTEMALDPIRMLRRIDRLEHTMWWVKALLGIVFTATGIVLGHMVVSWMSARDVPPPPPVSSNAERTTIDRAPPRDAGRP